MGNDLALWAGVDVGGEKGYDVAVINTVGLVKGPTRIARAAEVIAYLSTARPLVVAVDSPRRPAPPGALSREGEKALTKAKVCGIRYTPNREVLAGNKTYYGWILNGFVLYKLLDKDASGGLGPIECFPTATWSCIGGQRGKRTRARWSREVLYSCGLNGLPTKMNQDARDAIGAALTARLHTEGKTEQFGDIVVPRLASQEAR